MKHKSTRATLEHECQIRFLLHCATQHMPRSLSILFVILALQHAYAELHQRSQSFNTMGSGLMQVRPHKSTMGTLRNSECKRISANSKPSALAQLGKLRADHTKQRMVVESVQSPIPCAETVATLSHDHTRVLALGSRAASLWPRMEAMEALAALGLQGVWRVWGK